MVSIIPLIYSHIYSKIIVPSKKNRHSALITAIENRLYSSQDGVVDHMRSLGFEVTQPSISRDFRELGVVKLAGRYVLADRAKARPPAAEDVAQLVTGLEAAGPNLLIVRTEIGAANVVALEIDRLPVDGVAGTIAGDDTIFIATKGRAAQDQLARRLRSDIGAST